ncbi:hypothetical protein Tco_0324257 [Tanacetum coccineum]
MIVVSVAVIVVVVVIVAVVVVVVVMVIVIVVSLAPIHDTSKVLIVETIVEASISSPSASESKALVHPRISVAGHIQWSS